MTPRPPGDGYEWLELGEDTGPYRTAGRLLRCLAPGDRFVHGGRRYRLRSIFIARQGNARVRHVALLVRPL